MAYNPYYNSNPYFQQQPNFYGNGAMPDMLNQQKMQYQQMPQQTIPTQADPMLWVLGQTEAESYPVAPNNTVTLWDKNLPTIYIKSVNAQGVPSMRVLDFVERASATPAQPAGAAFNSPNIFATIEQFNSLKSDVEALRGKFDELRPKNTPKTKKTEVEDDG